MLIVARHRSDLLGGVIEYRLRVDLEPAARIPSPCVIPEGAPDGVVEPDDEEDEIAGSSRHRRDLLSVVIEYRLRVDLEPAARIPSPCVIPEGAPDGVVEPDDEEIEIAGSSRHRSDLLSGVIEYRLRVDLEAAARIPSPCVIPERSE